MKDTKFVRIISALKEEHKALYEKTIEETQNDSDTYRKLNKLTEDCFGGHIGTSIYAGSQFNLQINHPDRLIQEDTVTNFFIENIYKAPELVYERNNTIFSYESFKKIAISNPISNNLESKDNPTLQLGSNKATCIKGDVGLGKTTLINKVIYELKQDLFKKKRDAFGFYVVPVYIDFEEKHTLSYDEGFWDELYLTINNACLEYDKDNTLLKQLFDDFRPTSKSRNFICIKEIVRELAFRKMRLCIIIDNIDRFHFNGEKEMFFDQGFLDQYKVIVNNVVTLLNQFLDPDKLWNSGLNLIFICRDYLYEYLKPTNIQSKSDFDVFHLKKQNPEVVITSRIDLLNHAFAFLNTKKDSFTEIEFGEIKSFQESFHKIDETLKDFKGHHIKNLENMTHNGLRCLQDFFSEVNSRCKSAISSERVFGKWKLHYILYMLSNHRTYSQKQQHFPNLFLIDAQASPNIHKREYYSDHKHTYWLKYQILKYVQYYSSGRDKYRKEIRVGQIIKFFTEDGQYKEELVRLCLGSLASVNQSRCIEIIYSQMEHGKYISECSVKLTKRGLFLLSKDFGDNSSNIEFCFYFRYLQLVIVDCCMSYPKAVLEFIFDVDNQPFTYDYIYSIEKDKYQEGLKKLIPQFISCYYFVTLLEVSLDYQKKHQTDDFNHTMVKVDGVPNFTAIKSSILNYGRTIIEQTHVFGFRQATQEFLEETTKSDIFRADLESFYFELSIEEQMVGGF